MPWKYDEDGNLQVQEVDGVKMPIWVDESEKESPFNADKAMKKIQDLNGEAKDRREKLEAAEAQLKVLENIDLGEDKKLDDWIGEATKALETVSNFKQSDFVKAEEVEKIKQSVAQGKDKEMEALKKNLEVAIENLKGEVSNKDAAFRKLMVERAIEGSNFLKKTIFGDVPEGAINMFGRHFEVEIPENGGAPRVVAKDTKGDKIYSSGKNPGELADVEEALEVLITSHPKKDNLLIDARKQGSGADGPVGADPDKPAAGLYPTMN